MRYRLAALAAVSALALGGVAQADSVFYNAPHFTAATGSESATLNGTTFVNQGLVGVGRLSPNLLDFRGETLGSFSSLAVVRKTWHRNADGSYGGFLYTLPDRGPNNVGGLTTTDYAARLNGFDFSFTPYNGAANLASGATQLTLRQAGGILLTDTTGAVFTGRDPGAGVVTRDGVKYPFVTAAGDPGLNKIAIDSEGLVLLNDGSFYVSDEYGAIAYYFDKAGKQIGGIQAGPDITPTVNGVVNFNGVNDSPLVAGSTGRRSNQGMEGIAVSADNTRLYTLLQSATLQDNPTNVAQRRNNTRLMVYDISGSKTPTTPIAEYVLQLPVYNTGGAAATPNATAAQSELLALNDHQFLVLSRDGNGRGTDGNAKPIVFKSVLLVDTAGATNIAGGTYATSTTPISTSTDANGAGALVAGVTPVQQTELVNMLNTPQLTKFGINTTTNPSTQFTLSEKWEAMGLLSALDEAHPQDYFLVMGNDNDFVSSNVVVKQSDGTTLVKDASLTSVAAGTGVNDNQMMVYRLTLPTYIDPEALAQLNYQFRATAGFINDEAAAQASAATDGPMAQLDVARRADQDGQVFGSGVRVWSQSNLASVELGNDFGARNAAVSFGVDNGFGGLARVGLFGGLQTASGANQTRVDSWTLGVSGGFKAQGFYGQAALGHSELNGQYSRPAAYSQYANGKVGGDLTTSQVELGWLTSMSSLELGPFASYAQVSGSIDAVSENGASVSNVVAPSRDIKRTSSRFGVEVSGKASGSIAVLKLGYESQDQKDKGFNASLAAVSGAGGAAVIKPDDNSHDGMFASVAVENNRGPFSWRVSAEAKDAGDKTDLGVGLGFAQRF